MPRETRAQIKRKSETDVSGDTTCREQLGLEEIKGPFYTSMEEETKIVHRDSTTPSVFRFLLGGL